MNAVGMAKADVVLVGVSMFFSRRNLGGDSNASQILSATLPHTQLHVEPSTSRRLCSLVGGYKLPESAPVSVREHRGAASFLYPRCQPCSAQHAEPPFFFFR